MRDNYGIIFPVFAPVLFPEIVLVLRLEVQRGLLTRTYVGALRREVFHI